MASAPHLRVERDLDISGLQLTIGPDATTISSEVTGWARHWDHHEMAGDRRDELIDAVTGSAKIEEWRWPGMPPISVDAITDVTGHLDMDSGTLRLDPIDEHGVVRGSLVLPFTPA